MKKIGSGFQRRAALGHQVEVGDLAAPEDPRPRVVRRRRREQQRERGHGKAAHDDQDHLGAVALERERERLYALDASSRMADRSRDQPP